MIPDPHVGWMPCLSHHPVCSPALGPGDYIRKYGLWGWDKNGAEVGAGTRATHNGAGIDVIAP